MKTQILKSLIQGIITIAFILFGVWLAVMIRNHCGRFSSEPTRSEILERDKLRLEIKKLELEITRLESDLYW